METKIPGMKAEHAIITPRCQQVQGGPLQAFDVAVNRLKHEYAACVSGSPEATFHLVLTVEPVPPGKGD